MTRHTRHTFDHERLNAWRAQAARGAQARHDAVQRNHEALRPAIERMAREQERARREAPGEGEAAGGSVRR